MRLLNCLSPRVAAGRLSVVAVTRDPQRLALARSLGARALAIDLDERRSTARLGGLAGWAIHLAPPPERGEDDFRLGRLIAARGRATAALAHRGLTRAGGSPRWTLIGTSGVYGDCAGARIDETRRVAPTSDRGRRRAAAESRLRRAVRTGLLRGSILRVPGIYAQDRLPVTRLRQARPMSLPGNDPYTNLIHGDDLARIAWIALFRGRPGRAVNAVDDSELTMGEWFDRVADALGLPRPPRLPGAQLAGKLSSSMLPFVSESRRLQNRRLKHELRVRLLWATVDTALASPQTLAMSTRLPL